MRRYGNKYVYLQGKPRRMDKQSLIYRIYDLYADGFRSMTLGKTLWAVIIVKLLIIFAVLKLFFFPNYIEANAPEGGEADFVATEMMERGAPAGGGQQ